MSNDILFQIVSLRLCIVITKKQWTSVQIIRAHVILKFENRHFHQDSSQKFHSTFNIRAHVILFFVNHHFHQDRPRRFVWNIKAQVKVPKETIWHYHVLGLFQEPWAKRSSNFRPLQIDFPPFKSWTLVQIVSLRSSKQLDLANAFSDFEN